MKFVRRDSRVFKRIKYVFFFFFTRFVAGMQCRAHRETAVGPNRLFLVITFCTPRSNHRPRVRQPFILQYTRRYGLSRQKHKSNGRICILILQLLLLFCVVGHHRRRISCIKPACSDATIIYTS